MRTCIQCGCVVKLGRWDTGQERALNNPNICRPCELLAALPAPAPAGQAGPVLGEFTDAGGQVRRCVFLGVESADPAVSLLKVCWSPACGGVAISHIAPESFRPDTAAQTARRWADSWREIRDTMGHEKRLDWPDDVIDHDAAQEDI